MSVTYTQTLPKGKKANLEREVQGCMIVLWYSIFFLTADVFRQVASYAVKYYNHNSYPVPQTEIVAIVETGKFFISLVEVISADQLKLVRLNLPYALPSFLFALTNNVYYWALHYTTPPIWNILIQLKMVTTPLAYRYFMKKYLSPTQWIGMVIIFISTILAHASFGLDFNAVKQTTLTRVFLVVGVLVTVAGSGISSMTVEYLYKNDSLPFNVMQVQLYFFSMIGTWFFFFLEYNSAESQNVSGNPWLVYGALISCVISSCVSGIMVAVVVKRLDAIVKLYFQALSNISTSIACATLFPDHFQFSVNFLACLIMIICGVFVLEFKNIFRGGGPKSINVKPAKTD